MINRNQLGFALIPAVLVFTGLIIKSLAMWSSLANHTLPWLCLAIAIAILLLGAVSAILQAPPAAIPGWIATSVVAIVLLIFGAGMLVDWVYYETSHDVWASVAEWFGFAVILIGIFALPYARKSTEQTLASTDAGTNT